MKKIYSLSLLISLLSLSSFANDGDMLAVKSCLKNFGKHPFDIVKPQFSAISTNVKVLGIGGKTNDEEMTKSPQLVLVKSNGTVLSKNVLSLMNPKGWYCLKGQVAVLGKAEIHLHCQAKLASSQDGVTILGGGADKGVTELGSTRIVQNCDNKVMKIQTH